MVYHYHAPRRERVVASAEEEEEGDESDEELALQPNLKEAEAIVQQLGCATLVLIILSSTAFLYALFSGFALGALAAHIVGTGCWAAFLLRTEVHAYAAWLRVGEVANTAVAVVGFVAIAAVQGRPGPAVLYALACALYLALAACSRKQLASIRMLPSN